MRLCWSALLLLTPECIHFSTAVAHMRRKASVREKKAYDTSVRGFSPDGSIYQVEYAVQAAEKGGLTIGVQTDQGLILAAQGRRRSPLLKRSSVSKIAEIDTCMSCAMSGLLPDGRLLVDFARTWIQEHRFEFDEAPSVEAVASQLSRLALKFNGYDKDGKSESSGREEDDGSGGGLAMARPVGVALLMAGIDRGGRPVLYHLDPSGAYSQWRAKAIGEKGAAAEAKLDTAGPYGEISIKRAMAVVLGVLKDVLVDDFSTDRLEMVYVDLSDSRDGDDSSNLVAPAGVGGDGDLEACEETHREVSALPSPEGVEDASNGGNGASSTELAMGDEVCTDERVSSRAIARDSGMFRKVSKSEIEALLLSVEEAEGQRAG